MAKQITKEALDKYFSNNNVVDLNEILELVRIEFGVSLIADPNGPTVDGSEIDPIVQALIKNDELRETIRQAKVARMDNYRDFSDDEEEFERFCKEV